MVRRAACLCQPEALNLDLPEMQVKHRHNDLFLEQTKDVNLPTLAGACKSTEMSFTQLQRLHTCITRLHGYLQHHIGSGTAIKHIAIWHSNLAQQASTLLKKCAERSDEAIAAIDAAIT